MPVYNKAKLITLTRTALNMSKKDLCQGICSPRTLSRIENGEAAANGGIFNLLMERMGRPMFIESTVRVSSDPRWFEVREHCNNANYDYDYESLKMAIKQDEHPAATQIWHGQFQEFEQYLLCFLDEEFQRQDAYDLIDQAIRRTAPDYERYIDSVFPYSLQECRCFMNLGNSCNDLRPQENKKALSIYKMVLRCLDAGYMIGKDVDDLYSQVLFNCSYVLTDEGCYNKSLEISNRLIGQGIADDHGRQVVNSLSEITMIQKKQGLLARGDMTEAQRKRNVRKVIYLNMLTGNTYLEDRIRERNSDVWD